MSNRRNFLKAILGASLATGTSTFLQACAGGLSYYKGKIESGIIRIPKTDAPALKIINGIMMVKAPGVNGPIILRNLGDQIVAVSAICTHRGCEVRPLPDSLQCPCHGSQYDELGNVIEGPARQPLKRFPVTERDGVIVIELV